MCVCVCVFAHETGVYVCARVCVCARARICTHGHMLLCGGSVGGGSRQQAKLIEAVHLIEPRSLNASVFTTHLGDGFGQRLARPL